MATGHTCGEVWPARLFSAGVRAVVIALALVAVALFSTCNPPRRVALDPPFLLTSIPRTPLHPMFQLPFVSLEHRRHTLQPCDATAVAEPLRSTATVRRAPTGICRCIRGPVGQVLV